MRQFRLCWEGRRGQMASEEGSHMPNGARVILQGPAIVALLWVALFAGCRRAPAPQAHGPRPIVSARAIQRDVPIYVESFGSLLPMESIDVKAEVTGKVLSYHFTEGQFVREGDLLYVIDTNQYAATLSKNQASLEQSVAKLANARDTLARNRQLFAQKVIATNELEAAETMHEEARAINRLAEAEVRLARLDLDHCTIEAPVAGYAGARLVDPGNIVPANTGPALVNIKRMDRLRLDFTIPEKYASRARATITPSNTVYALLTPQGAESVMATGVVNFINNTVDNQTGTIALRADVPNADTRLWAGQFVNIKFLIGEQKDAVLVPYTAVQNGQMGPYVFIVTPTNTAALRQVAVGLRHDDLIAIDSGISPGETVVTVGQMGLAPGVEVAEARPPRDAGARAPTSDDGTPPK